MSFRLSLYLRNVGVLLESCTGVITGREPMRLFPFQLEEKFWCQASPHRAYRNFKVRFYIGFFFIA